ncbi:hypothetical protein GCM10023165_23940 [Variovorax defluvii]|uniref:Uncharacterized protein n=1 Tax=Variovorax defluvii TaxID=913761 RepID=A0ABP8HPL8_9BURK
MSTRPGLAFTTLTLLDSTPPSQVQEQFCQARKKVGDEAGNRVTSLWSQRRPLQRHFAVPMHLLRADPNPTGEIRRRVGAARDIERDAEQVLSTVKPNK